MKIKSEILQLIGAIIIVLSALITFKTNLPERVENILYFRGILFGTVIFSCGKIIVTYDILIKNMWVAITSGTGSLFIVSSINLIIDKSINLSFYFDITFTVMISTFISIIVVKFYKKILVWIRQILKGL